MPGSLKEGFIPIQRCYPEEYEEYRVFSEYWEDDFLPIQVFRIKFRKKTGMVLYPHACTLLHFEFRADGEIGVRIVGRVTETMCSMHEPDTLYWVLRFPPQYIFEAFQGKTNIDEYIDLQLFDHGDKIREAMLMADDKECFYQLMHIIKESRLGFKENQLIDEFAFNSLYNEENLSIEEIVENMSYSPRYIRNVIKNLTGINAKRLYDILRLQNIMESQLSSDEDSMSCVYDFGFYDQAHLNKNIRKLTGLSYTSFKSIIKEKNKT